MTGYQQGILLALGSQLGDRYAVRSIDKWYPDSVQPLFNARVFSVSRKGREVPQWCVKSAHVRPPELTDVIDWQGFCRAWIEIHAGLVPITQYRMRGGVRYKTHVPGLKIFGPRHILETIQEHLPVVPKRLQELVREVDGGQYTGRTWCITLQKQDTINTLEYIDGLPKNQAVWDKWDAKIEHVKHMD